MGARTGNPAWVDSATEVEAQANPGRRITAAKLNAIEAAIDASAEATHTHDARYVRTVNGTGPDGSGNVVVSGGGSAPDATTSVKGIVRLTNHLGGTADAPTVRAASTTQTGIVELATNTEATTGTDTERAVTPAGLKAVGDTKAPVRTTPTEVAGATYTLAAADENAGIRTTSATAVTITVPSTLPVGYTCPILVDGAGMVTVVAGSGVTLVHAEPPLSRKTGSALAVQIVASGRAWVVGDFA